MNSNDKWDIIFADTFAKALTKLKRKNPQIYTEIVQYLKIIRELDDPTERGKPLTSNLAGLWRYRVREYRIICQIDNGRLIITALAVGHRSKIYTS